MSIRRASSEANPARRQSFAALQSTGAMAAWRAMKRRLLPLAVAFLSAISAAGARAEPPVIGTLRLVAPLAHCAFFAAGGEQEDPAEAIFATELVSDDLAAAERGYMRIDGLLRELVLEERKETE